MLAILSILPGDTIGTLYSVTGVSPGLDCCGAPVPVVLTVVGAGTSEDEDVMPLFPFCFRSLLNFLPCPVNLALAFAWDDVYTFWLLCALVTKVLGQP